jgi:hypothetical protein
MVFLILGDLRGRGQSNKYYDYLISFTDTVTDRHGYKNRNGDTVISLDKYGMCFTDTFRTYAIVLKSRLGFVAIDRKQNVLYQVFPFDNGPDNTSNGLFRILKNNKIGYADSVSGHIVIKPQFACAFSFENGIAKVTKNCKVELDGEHRIWISDNWFYINKRGKKVKPPK